MRPLLALLCLIGTSLSLPVQACNVPVFRYALERWPADRYLVVVVHRGELSADKQALADTLARASEEGTANLVFHAIDLAKEGDEAAAPLFAGQPPPVLPCLVVRYPREAGIKANVWAGPLEAPAVRTLLDSPARQAIAQRILAGESAVWVLLESGDQDKDDAAARLLQQQLDELPKVLQLPERTDDPQDQINEQGPPLRLAFSLVRVARTDPAEQMFVQQLLHLEEDLHQLNEPMVFAVFGRGRCLLPMIGKGITAENIASDAAGLVAACSCEVKRLNPGVDLLMSMPWEERLGGPSMSHRLPKSADMVPVPIPPGLPPVQTVSETVELTETSWRSWLMGGGLVSLGLLATGLLVLLAKSCVCAKR